MMSRVAGEFAHHLDRELAQRHHEVQTIAEMGPLWIGDAATLRAFFDALSASLGRYAWIGFAGPDGVVRAATGGEFEGQSVTETSWFQEARLTANRQGRGASLPAGGVAPDRFNGTMTISAPVVDARGDVLGVVGATLSTEWADEIRDSFMRPLAAQDRDRAAAISIGLMSSDGRSVLGAPSGAAMLSADEVRAVAHTGPGLRRLDVGGIPYLAAIGQSGNASASGVDAAGRHEAAKWVVVAGEPEAAIETQTKPIITIIVIAAALSGGIGALLAFVMAARIASPLGWLADEAERIGRQVAAEPGDRFGKLDEISRLSRALEVLATRNENWEWQLAVARERAERASALLNQEIAGLRRLAECDPMTGALNRRGLEARLAETRAVMDPRHSLGVLVVDIDHFKNVNDCYGHGVGDEVICRVADTIRGAVRQSDIVARFGGEEFVVIVANAVEDELAQLAERIRVAVASAEDVEALAPGVTVSIGAAQERDFTLEVETLIERADGALYLAKQAGRNCVRLRSDDATPFSGRAFPTRERERT